MTDPRILIATLAAAYLYVVTPGPAFLALFTLAASRGRRSGAWFIIGHLVGDVTWGALAVAAIVGANQIGPTLFELLGLVCGLYLIYLGWRAVTTRKNAPPRTIGAKRPLATGMAFGLTNPKSYPVALAMFSAIVAPYIGNLTIADAPQMFVAAFLGFLLADADSHLHGRPARGAAFLSDPRRRGDAGGRRHLHSVRGALDRRCGGRGDAADGVRRHGPDRPQRFQSRPQQNQRPPQQNQSLSATKSKPGATKTKSLFLAVS